MRPTIKTCLWQRQDQKPNSWFDLMIPFPPITGEGFSSTFSCGCRYKRGEAVFFLSHADSDSVKVVGTRAAWIQTFGDDSSPPNLLLTQDSVTQSTLWTHLPWSLFPTCLLKSSFLLVLEALRCPCFCPWPASPSSSIFSLISYTQWFQLLCIWFSFLASSVEIHMFHCLWHYHLDILQASDTHYSDRSSTSSVLSNSSRDITVHSVLRNENLCSTLRFSFLINQPPSPSSCTPVALAMVQILLTAILG